MHKTIVDWISLQLITAYETTTDNRETQKRYEQFSDYVTILIQFMYCKIEMLLIN